MSAEAGFSGTDRFEVRREVGSGGFGTVYQAWDREHHQLVALKHLHRSDPLALRRFKQEFRALANLAHLHLVALYELHQADANWFFTMEYVDGASFAEWLRPGELSSTAHGSSLAMTRPARPRARQATAAPESRGAAAASPLHATTVTPIARPPLVVDGDVTPSAVLGELESPPRITSPLAARPQPTVTAGPAERAGPRPSTPAHTPQPTPLDLAQPFFGIEIPDEATLALWEATRPRGGAPPPDPDRIRHAFRQLVEALAWLHASGHLHRDVKPSNVLVSPSGVVKVLDFGLVTRLFASDPGLSDPLIGTPAYMAPELCAGLSASPASDWYSVGVMLYLVLTGSLPFAGDLPSVVLAKQALDVRPPSELTDVPRDLEEICLALLSKNPVERPDATALLQALGDKRRATPRWTHAAAQSVFVGRRAEVSRLAAVVGGAEPTQIALVEGLSGLGKSALVEHVLRSIEETGETLVLRSRCFERGSVRYRALDGAIDDLARWLSTLPSFQVDDLLPSDPSDRVALARLFPALPAVSGDDEDTLGADPAELKRRAFVALRQLLAAAANKRVELRHGSSAAPDDARPSIGIVFSIDDAQWADEDSLTPLAELMRQLPAEHVRWVIAYRSDELESSPFLKVFSANVLRPLASRTARIELGPLPPDEAVALAAEQLGRASPEQARAIALESEGSPLFIAELSRLIDNRSSDGIASLSDEPVVRRAGLGDLLAARVLDLPVQGRVALELIAVAGEPIPARLVRAATGVDQRDLNRLVHDHLVAARPSAVGELVMTWHDRVRETVAWRLSKDDRARRHQTLAVTAEALGGADDLFLHIHWREAGVEAKAREHGLRAAEAAMRAFAFDRAAELYRSIIAMAPAAATPAHHEALGDALKNAGRGADAAKAYLEAAARARDPVEVRRLEIRAAEQFMFAGAFGEGEAVIRKVLGRVGLSVAQGVPGAFASFALETLRNRLRGLGFTRRDASAIPPEELALIDTLWSVTIGLSMAQPLASQAFQQRHLRVALEAGEPLRVARALTIELAFSGLQGGNDERRSLSLSKLTHDVAKSIAHPYPEAFATMADGATHWLRGRWPEARRAMEDALVVFDRDCTGVSWEKDTSRFVALSALAHGGELVTLRAEYERSLEDALERGDLYLEAQLRTRFAPLIELLEDRPDAARAVIHQTLGRWTAAGYQVVHYWGYLNRVSSFLYEGDGRAAWRELLAGMAPLERSFMTMGQYYRIQYHALIGKTALAALATARTPGEARVLRARALKAARRLAKEDMAWSRPDGLLIEAALDRRPGDHRWSAAREGFAAASMHGHRLATEALQAEASGDAPALAAAHEAFARLGARVPEQFRRYFSGI